MWLIVNRHIYIKFHQGTCGPGQSMYNMFSLVPSPLPGKNKMAAGSGAGNETSIY